MTHDESAWRLLLSCLSVATLNPIGRPQGAPVFSTGVRRHVKSTNGAAFAAQPCRPWRLCASATAPCSRLSRVRSRGHIPCGFHACARGHNVACASHVARHSTGGAPCGTVCGPSAGASAFRRAPPSLQAWWGQRYACGSTALARFPGGNVGRNGVVARWAAPPTGAPADQAAAVSLGAVVFEPTPPMPVLLAPRDRWRRKHA